MKEVFKLLSILIVFFGCGPSNYGSNGGQVIVQPASTPTPGLDLQALGNLVKSCSSAKDIETKLNSPSTGINNLDLSNSGKVDYINVSEYDTNNTHGFTFYVVMPDKSQQEVATIEVQPGQNNQAQMNICGNQSVYGPGNSYSSNYSMTDLLIYGYLFGVHPCYVSPYYFGYYPSYYSRWSCMPYNTYYSSLNTRYGTSYRSRMVRTTTVTHSPYSRRYNSSSYTNSNNSYSRRSSLSNSNSSQKQFQTRNNSVSHPSNSSSNKFSNSNRSSSPRSSSSSRSFGGSSSRSFGGRRH